MGAQPDGTDAGEITVDSVRNVVRSVAAELAAAGAREVAADLEEAADLKASPAEELLAMREVLVRTRRHWDVPNGATRRDASRALTLAKRLAIDL